MGEGLRIPLTLSGGRKGRLGVEIILLNYCKCLQINSPFFQGITARLRSETTLPTKWIVAPVQIGTVKGAKSVPHHLAQAPRPTQNRKSPRTMRPARIPIYGLINIKGS
jgi:ABC-type uncharacterized transport system YnjBCD ATPase subunit